VRVGLRHARKHLGWSLNVAADTAGVAPETLTRWRQTVLTSEQPSAVKASLGEAFDDFAWRAAA
jgi:tRNA-dihydrouridine synthase B